MSIKKILLPLAVYAALIPAHAALAAESDVFYNQPVYQVADDLKSCEALPQGVPVQMGVTQDTRKSIRTFLNGKAAIFNWKDEGGGLHSSYVYLDKAECETLELSRDSSALKRDPDLYVANLKASVEKHLHFQSERAERIVTERRLQCGERHPGRYVPLVNLLYVSLSSINRPPRFWLEIKVNDDSGGVNIVHELHGEKATQDVRRDYSGRNVNISADGRMSQINPEILSQACRNQYGPIWREE